MKTRIATVIAGFLLSAPLVFAGTDIYFGEDRSPYPPYPAGPNDVPRPVYTNSQRVAAQFLARLPGVTIESFEGRANGSSPTNLTFGTNIATLNGTREVFTVLDPTMAPGGGFPTTGTNCLALTSPVGNVRSFTVTFSTPQAAFGFYGMDVEQNRFAVRLMRQNGTTSDIPVSVTVPQGSGGVFFFGVIDKDSPFTSVEFRNIGTSDETFFFDDLTIAVPELVVPPRLDMRVSHVELCWDTVTNNFYQLQYRSSLTTNVWMPLGGPVFGDGSRFCTNDAVVIGQPQRFYQLAITNSP